MSQSGPVVMEFHVSRRARERYRFDEALFSLTGNVVLADFYAARLFAQKMNEQRDLARSPEKAVRAGQINAMGLIDEMLHAVIARYRAQASPAMWQQALNRLYGDLGRSAVDATLRLFIDEFPPMAVYRGEIDAAAYLEGESGGVPHRHVLLEEMLILWLANQNPAFAPFRELFDDSALIRASAYQPALDVLHRLFAGQPSAGPVGESLLDLLLSPARAFPESLTAQLEYIRRRWGLLLGSQGHRLLIGLDLVREEEKPVFAGPGPALVYEFDHLQAEPEAFSPDLHWMPRLVLMAKNAYVWLHQLSQRHRRPIIRLDQVPDEELDLLARWGFTGLWLIGLWERSPASRTVKQLCGNPEAVASAYSLYDYQVAADLGGEPAFASLRERAWRRGIRMASDMVPNHVGVYSRWVIEHPDWFISLDSSPFPSHTFNGPDLSLDPRVGIFVEDHYYDRTDAAVVFKRLDRWTGSEQYIYHGNDGTRMPWNDTAQLNYLDPQVREAVIQTILHVARQTPIIRFDAAMTLTKQHYQRLWFPEPGTGGSIPTRAEHGLTKAEFDAAMPAEFWREVVDRVAAEAPDTLLLAEAFWLMEGYFVRSLGMHRVYNSAFMHMLRDEDNAKYRSVIKNTLQFDPEVLKRYVNFMNNPDEDTAVAQFGKGDKYFGIATLLATLPGLPMFGHGQVDGLAEKYGMEYRRAYWDEQPDADLVERHRREIFPLLHRRALFAEAEQFLLYDFLSADGSVNEDVFAYSNRAGEERGLVVYHNRFATAHGWIRSSVAYAARTGQGDVRKLVQRTLGEGLGLKNEPGFFAIFRDQIAGLEYIRTSTELCETGLYVELDAYRCHAFLDWREVQDDEERCYARLAESLGGGGVPSIDEALREMFLQRVLRPFRELVDASLLRQLIEAGTLGAGSPVPAEVLEQVEQRLLVLHRAIQEHVAGSRDEGEIAAEIRRKLVLCLGLSGQAATPHVGPGEAVRGAIQAHLRTDLSQWASLLGWLVTHALGKIEGGENSAAVSRRWLDEWLLAKQLGAAFRDLGLDDKAATWAVGTVNILIGHGRWFEIEALPEERAARLVDGWLHDPEVRRFLQVNRYQDRLWFNKESFDQLLDWLLTVAVVELSADPGRPAVTMAGEIDACYDLLTGLRRAAARSGYQVAGLLEEAQLPHLVGRASLPDETE